MKKNVFKKLTAIVLACAAMLSLSGAAAADKAASEEKPAYDSGDMTVYVMTDAAGKAEKLYLTEMLSQALPEGKAGRGIPMFNSDGVKVEKPSIGDELPIEISVSYTLDGKKISPRKLAGKSGHVVMRYEYENLCKTKAMIAGSEEEIFVPFAVMTGMVLDNSSFKNIQVSSGKVVSDGARSVVAGIALPGMQENLNISKEYIDLPDFVEISADVDNFQLAMSLSLVTNDIFGDNEELTVSTEDLENAVSQLREAMNMLLDGSSRLYDGICQLFDKSGMLVDGVTQLNDGMQQLDAHSGELNAGAEQVFNSLLAMAEQQIRDKGLEVGHLTIGNYNDVLGALIDSLSPDSMIETIKAQIIAKLEPTRPEFEQTAYVMLASKYEQQFRREEHQKIYDQVAAEQREQLYEATAAAVKVEVGLEVTDQVRLEIQNEILGDRVFDELSKIEQADIAGKIALRMAAPETLKTIADRTDEMMASDEVQKRIDEKINDAAKVAAGIKIAEQHEAIEHTVGQRVAEQMETEETKALIKQQGDDMMNEAVAKALKLELVNNIIMQQAEEGVKQLTEALANLNAYAEFYYGLRTYTAGVSTAAEGVATLYGNMPALVSGINQLKDGGKMLNEGVQRFDREGISRITNALDGDVGELKDRLTASFEAAKNYRGVDGLAEDLPCVSFVYRGESISAD